MLLSKRGVNPAVIGFWTVALGVVSVALVAANRYCGLSMKAEARSEFWPESWAECGVPNWLESEAVAMSGGIIWYTVPVVVVVMGVVCC